MTQSSNLILVYVVYMFHIMHTLLANILSKDDILYFTNTFVG